MDRPPAYVVHRTRGRLRLRFPTRRGDEAFFELAREELEALPWAEEVRVNPGTGSALLRYPESGFEALEGQLRAATHFVLTDGRVPPVQALEPLIAGVSRLDRAIAGFTSGAADLRTVLFIVAVILAIRQFTRGKVLGPAMPLLWMALELGGRIAASLRTDEPLDVEGEAPAGAKAESGS